MTPTGMLYSAWVWVRDLMARTLANLALVGVFVLVVTPVGFLRRLSGRSPYRASLDRRRASYWEPPRATNEDEAGYRVQF